MGVIVYYHYNCNDGWCAAYILKKKFPEAELVSVYYDTDDSIYIEKAKNKLVYIVDYCFSVGTTKAICEVAVNVVVADHHKGAADKIYDIIALGCNNIKVIFDDSNEWSGASLAFREAFPNEEEPWWVSYTAANDTGRWFALPELFTHMSYMTSFRREELEWDRMIELYDSNREKALSQGEACSRSYNIDIEEIVKAGTLIEFEGITTVAASCAPKGKATGVANKIASVYGLGIAYTIMNKNGAPSIEISLRARKDSDINCITLAEKYGGSGHQKAAGIPTSLYNGLRLLGLIHENSKVNI